MNIVDEGRDRRKHTYRDYLERVAYGLAHADTWPTRSPPDVVRGRNGPDWKPSLFEMWTEDRDVQIGYSHEHEFIDIGDNCIQAHNYRCVRCGIYPVLGEFRPCLTREELLRRACAAFDRWVEEGCELEGLTTWEPN